jgi:hypothetical protein
LIGLRGIWPATGQVAGSGGITGWGAGRVVALDAAAGTVSGVAALDGAPLVLALAPAPVGVGRRPYVAVALPGADVPEAWRLEARDPLTLQLLGSVPLALPPRALAVAPDGAVAYALGASAATRGSLTQVDLTTGAARRLAQLPGPALDLALAGDRLYAPDPPGDRQWVVDRRSGALLRPVPVGRQPVAVAAVGPP